MKDRGSKGATPAGKAPKASAAPKSLPRPAKSDAAVKVAPKSGACIA